MPNKAEISVFWFRRDLRLHDNTGLYHALDGRYPVLPIFIFDPIILKKVHDQKDARVQFIHDQITNLKTELERWDSTLHIYHNTPENVFRDLLNYYSIRAVYANRDYEPYAISRDKGIAELLAQRGIKFLHFKDHVVFEGKEIVKKDGSPFKVFTPFKKVWLDRFNNRMIRTVEDSLPFEALLNTPPADLPSLESLGFESTPIQIPSSKIQLKTLQEYGQNRDYPALNGTSRLGIHLRFGTISIRDLTSMASRYSQSFLNELIWREFYSAILQHFPHVVNGAFHKKYDLIPWKNDESDFKRWCEGRTGYPIVDAGMRQLNRTGYMHNRIRMITASFLAKHLLIDWQWGEAYFARKLLDYDLASNNGGWQWAAGTGTDAQPYFRIFNPEAQTQKFDPVHEYINRWVPEIGTRSYPEPIVDHRSARLRAIEVYRSVVSK